MTKASDTTAITIALGGERGSGKTALVDYILMPALGALGGSIVNRSEDAKKGTETLTVILPRGALQKLNAAPDAERIGLSNINRVHKLAEQRVQLMDFLSDSEISGDGLRKMLPYALQGIQPKTLLDALQEEARGALAVIDKELTGLGFDLAEPSSGR